MATVMLLVRLVVIVVAFVAIVVATVIAIGRTTLRCQSTVFAMLRVLRMRSLMAVTTMRFRFAELENRQHEAETEEHQQRLLHDDCVILSLL